jgi:hypothetical protein
VTKKRAVSNQQQKTKLKKSKLTVSKSKAVKAFNFDTVKSSNTVEFWKINKINENKENIKIKKKKKCKKRKNLTLEIGNNTTGTGKTQFNHARKYHYFSTIKKLRCD